jgi:hypothetical protein
MVLMCGDALAAPIHSPSDKVAAFRGEYVRLRNIDPSTNDRGVRPLWQDLATRMDSFVRLQANKREFSQIRLKVDLIALLLRLYRVDGKSSHLERAGALSDELLPLAPTLEGGEIIAEQLRDELLLTAADVAIARGDKSAA